MGWCCQRYLVIFSPKGQWENIFLNKMSNNKEVSFFPFSSSFIVKSLCLVSWGNTIKSPLSRFHSQGKVLTSSNSQKNMKSQKTTMKRTQTDKRGPSADSAKMRRMQEEMEDNTENLAPWNLWSWTALNISANDSETRWKEHKLD